MTRQTGTRTTRTRRDGPDGPDGPVHHFRLDETSGTELANSGRSGQPATLVNAARATLTGRGVRFNPDDYADAPDGGHVRLPDDITAGMRSMSVAHEVWVDPADVGEHHLWGFGSRAAEDGARAGGGRVAVVASNTQSYRVAVGSQPVQQRRVRLPVGAWTHVAYTQSPNPDGATWTGTTYVDGVRHAQVDDLTVPPWVDDAGTGSNFLARSQDPGHYGFRGTVADFRVYDRALTGAEVRALAEPTVSEGVRADAAAIDLGRTDEVVADLVLPKVGAVAGSSITWTSSDDSVVAVRTPPPSAPKVDVTGRVTRPAVGEPDATATLTATVRKGADAVVVREVPVTVAAGFDDAEAVAHDVEDLRLCRPDDVRGDIALPRAGASGTTITWRSGSAAVTPTGEVSRPAYGHEAVEVTLTATVQRGRASTSRSFEVVVRPAPRREEYERYLLGYFKGEHLADGEQIMFATSDGNTALEWTGLTGGRPSLVSRLGDRGLRDPHIVRSPAGDTFYLIATDLNWYEQGGYDINDTQHIEVFESDDLVSWTPQRHVKVAPDDAGNAFAPESLWVEEIGAYAVFWAQSLWDDPVNRTGQGNAQLWVSTTRDFRSFSEPRVWQDPAPRSRIDTTAIKVGDTYYRFTKDERGDVGSDLFSEKHTDFLDGDVDAWTLLAPALGRTTWDPDQGYEGPVVFRANPGDTACPGQFYLWGDRYTDGGGYQAACSDDIEATTWAPRTITMTDAGVPRPRHGTVLPITLREWNDVRGIPNEDVATTTELTVDVDGTVPEGRPVEVSARVTAADSFQTGGRVRFGVCGRSVTATLDEGVAVATLPADLVPGSWQVTAEFLGHDVLEASTGTADLVVVPRPAGGVET